MNFFVDFRTDDPDSTALSSDMSVGRLVSVGKCLYDRQGDRKRQTVCVTVT